MKIFTVTQANFTRRKTMKCKMNCQICDVEVKVGDSVVTKRVGNRSSSIRHEACARRVGIID